MPAASAPFSVPLPDFSGLPAAARSAAGRLPGLGRASRAVTNSLSRRHSGRASAPCTALRARAQHGLQTLNSRGKNFFACAAVPCLPALR